MNWIRENTDSSKKKILDLLYEDDEYHPSLIELKDLLRGELIRDIVVEEYKGSIEDVYDPNVIEEQKWTVLKKYLDLFGNDFIKLTQSPYEGEEEVFVINKQLGPLLDLAILEEKLKSSDLFKLGQEYRIADYIKEQYQQYQQYKDQ